MIKKENYAKLKEKYGNIASWAIWDKPCKSKKNDNISGEEWCLNDDELMKNIKTKYVLVALNPHGDEDAEQSKEHDNILPWSQNFHTSANDRKLRDAVRGTSFEGSYITDLFKRKPTNGEERLKKEINEDDEKKAVEELEKEMALISDKTILIALGNKVFDVLIRHLSGPYVIRKIKHFACRYIKKNHEKKSNEYREEIENLIQRLEKKQNT